MARAGPGREAQERLGRDLRDRVLARLGFGAPPPVTVGGLNALYAAWGRCIPFDNVHKRLALAAGGGAPLPCATPEEFFAHYLSHGTGATCWPSSTALHALLHACGFEAIRIAGTMRPSGVRHGSVLVRIGDGEFLADTWMAAGAVLALAPTATAAGAAACRVRAEPHGSLWRVWYLHPARDEECAFEIEERDVDLESVRAGYESSRTNSRFNTRLFARKNVAAGVLCVTRGVRHVRGPAGIARRELAPGEQARILIEQFGYSDEIVARLPPDDPAD